MNSIDSKILDKLVIKNCGNCTHRNEKYKVLTCKQHNKLVEREDCCPLHKLEEPITTKESCFLITLKDPKECKHGRIARIRFKKVFEGTEEDIANTLNSLVKKKRIKTYKLRGMRYWSVK